VFNVFLLLFLAALCLTPALILGPAFSGSFWVSNWYLFLVFVLILAAVDSYYFINRRLFSLLEKEDWPALVYYLEEKIIRQGKYSPRMVQLLANTYLVLSDSAAVMSLEKKVAIAKPEILESNALIFGAAHVLGRDISGAVRFFGARLEAARGAGGQWIRWYYGFALLLDRQFDDAAGEYTRIAKGGSDGVVTGLACYFLADSLASSLPEKAEELKAVAGEGRTRVLKVLPHNKNWTREATKICTEIYAAALSKYIDEAGRWLYRKESA
jgi:hypothetical protein